MGAICSTQCYRTGRARGNGLERSKHSVSLICLRDFCRFLSRMVGIVCFCGPSFRIHSIGFMFFCMFDSLSVFAFLAYPLQHYSIATSWKPRCSCCRGEEKHEIRDVAGRGDERNHSAGWCWFRSSPLAAAADSECALITHDDHGTQRSVGEGGGCTEDGWFKIKEIKPCKTKLTIFVVGGRWINFG